MYCMFDVEAEKAKIVQLLQANVDAEALRLLKKNRKKALRYLTNYGIEWGDRVVDRAWGLGDELWTKYDEKF